MCWGEAGVGGNLIILGAWECRDCIFELKFLKTRNFKFSNVFVNFSNFLNFLRTQVKIFIIFDVLEVLGPPETEFE